jgi:homocitrate synthase NifV
MNGDTSIWLIDSTLRDGEQAPGVAFCKEEKVRLAQMLDETGIDEIEAGTPAMGDVECETIRAVVQMNLHARISVWCRAMMQDIEMAARTGAEAVHIAFPVSDIQLSAFGKSPAWLCETLPATVKTAAQMFAYVSVGAQDAGRADAERLRDFIGLAAENKVSRVRIADTVGILTPLQTAKMIEQVGKQYPALPVDFHAHNDLGMATANAVTAWDAGANALSVTVNGLGERSGNAALEEILMILSHRYGITKYRVSSLYALCRYVADISGRPLPEMKPVSGRWALSHESGIHVRGTIADTLAFQAFDGKTIGRESHEICFGKHSSRKYDVSG